MSVTSENFNNKKLPNVSLKIINVSENPSDIAISHDQTQKSYAGVCSVILLSSTIWLGHCLLSDILPLFNLSSLLLKSIR
jgi:hypothetical protein